MTEELYKILEPRWKVPRKFDERIPILKYQQKAYKGLLFYRYKSFSSKTNKRHGGEVAMQWLRKAKEEESLSGKPMYYPI